MNAKDIIYLDANATTPMAAEVQEVVKDAMANAWGNVSSSNVLGHEAKRYVERARKQTASMIQAKPGEIVFTSGGTESNCTILHTFAKVHRMKGGGDISVPHIITSNIEHDSVQKPLEQMHRDGQAHVTFVQVDKTSHAVRVADVLEAIRPNTVLITIMLANNETGVIQPIKDLSQAIQNYNQSSENRVYFHSDAAQAIGKIRVSVEDLGVDYLTIVGHKFYGPRIGALYVRNLEVGDCPLEPIFVGGGQERHYRAGTENTAMIAGLGAACELVATNIQTYQLHMQTLRDQLEEELSVALKSHGITFNGRNSLSERLPNTCNVSIVSGAFNGRTVLENCEMVVASVGAACHSKAGSKASAVLLASGIPYESACNALRLSVGRETTSQQISAAVIDICNAVHSINQSLNVSADFHTNDNHL